MNDDWWEDRRKAASPAPAPPPRDSAQEEFARALWRAWWNAKEMAKVARDHAVTPAPYYIDLGDALSVHG